ncbi:MAG: hypothetical protein WAZ77_13950, partial [Candidatus Nitrosopolaris sp.]
SISSLTAEVKSLFEIGGKVGGSFLVFISSLYYPVYLEFNRYGVNLHTVNNISKDCENVSKRGCYIQLQKCV